ncbi:unnamed protein product [Closterium sp. NIES-65]|nr:unnamed protein product [Closterium sp. NIES-65]
MLLSRLNSHLLPRPSTRRLWSTSHLPSRAQLPASPPQLPLPHPPNPFLFPRPLFLPPPTPHSLPPPVSPLPILRSPPFPPLLQVFLCYGQFIFGPDFRSLVLSFLLILIPGILFCVFVAAQLPGKIPGGIVVLPVAICYIAWNLFILVFTACRDPGIVPRNLVPPDPDPDIRICTPPFLPPPAPPSSPEPLHPGVHSVQGSRQRASQSRST